MDRRRSPIESENELFHGHQTCRAELTVIRGAGFKPCCDAFNMTQVASRGRDPRTGSQRPIEFPIPATGLRFYRLELRPAGKWSLCVRVLSNFADLLFSGQDCCGAPAGCDQPGDLSEVTKLVPAFGKPANLLPNAIEFEDIRTEIRLTLS